MRETGRDAPAVSWAGICGGGGRVDEDNDNHRCDRAVNDCGTVPAFFTGGILIYYEAQSMETTVNGWSTTLKLLVNHLSGIDKMEVKT